MVTEIFYQSWNCAMLKCTQSIERLSFCLSFLIPHNVEPVKWHLIYVRVASIFKILFISNLLEYKIGHWIHLFSFVTVFRTICGSWATLYARVSYKNDGVNFQSSSNQYLNERYFWHQKITCQPYTTADKL